MNSHFLYTPKSSSEVRKSLTQRLTISNLPEESFVKEKKTREMRDLKKEINRLLESDEGKPKLNRRTRTPEKWSDGHSSSNDSKSKERGKTPNRQLSNTSYDRYGSVQIFISNGSKVIELTLGGFTASQRRTLISKLNLQRISNLPPRLA